ncbi:MAG: DNA-processing protein DprA [Gammaproteobacteria bacterium]|nr:DNA-processing protein DprA [Gammaproteobacteria bacterium]
MDQYFLSQWLTLSECSTVSSAVISRLLRDFDSLQEIVDAPGLAAYGASPEILTQIRRALRQTVAPPHATKVLLWCQQPGNYIITRRDSAYPPLLKEIVDPPPWLFVRGRPETLLLPQVAIVGSRHCSVDGREVAALFASDLVSRGFSICSGLARGIDTAAHVSACKAKAATVGVLGCGVDKVYPSSNFHLAQEICHTGALVSELPLGSAARAEHFPKRNRIITGMSLGVIVIEAAERSGSLITARMAIEQNREVFAVPGSIRNPQSRGCHRMIREGATLVDSSEQVIEQLRSLVEFQIESLGIPRVEHAVVESPATTGDKVTGKEEREVLQQIGYDPVTVDNLIERVNIELSALHTILLRLELSGRIRCESGRYALS